MRTARSCGSAKAHRSRLLDEAGRALAEDVHASPGEYLVHPELHVHTCAKLTGARLVERVEATEIRRFVRIGDVCQRSGTPGPETPSSTPRRGQLEISGIVKTGGRRT